MNEEVVMGSGVGACILSTMAQTQEVMQIISISITCVAGSLTIIYTCYKMYQRMKADGKITGHELKEFFTKLGLMIKALIDKCKRK